METFYYEPSWLQLVREQESRLFFDRFTRQDALKIGLEIVRLARERYGKNAAVCILEDHVTVFACKMEGTGLENEWWMRRKLNTAQKTGMSSLRAYLEMKAGARLLPAEAERAGAYAACGGCLPIRMRGGEVRGYVLVSGMEHYEDHQVIADALSAHLGVGVPSVMR